MATNPPMHFPPAHPQRQQPARGGNPTTQKRFGTTGANQFGKLPGEWNRETGAPMGLRDTLNPPQRDPALQTPQDKARIAHADMLASQSRNQGPLASVRGETSPAASDMSEFASKPSHTMSSGPSTDYKAGPGSGEKVAVSLPGANAVDAAGPRPPDGTPAAKAWMDRVQQINEDIAKPHDAPQSKPTWANPDPLGSNDPRVAAKEDAQVKDFMAGEDATAVAQAAKTGGTAITQYGTASARQPKPGGVAPAAMPIFDTVDGKKTQVGISQAAPASPAGPTDYQKQQIALQQQIIKDNPDIGKAGTAANKAFVEGMQKNPGGDMKTLAGSLNPKPAAPVAAGPTGDAGSPALADASPTVLAPKPVMTPPIVPNAATQGSPLSPGQVTIPPSLLEAESKAAQPTAYATPAPSPISAQTTIQPGDALRAAVLPGQLTAGTTPQMTPTHMPSNAFSAGDQSDPMQRAVTPGQIQGPPTQLQPQTGTALGAMRGTLAASDLTNQDDPIKKPLGDDGSAQSPNQPQEQYA